MLILFMRRVDQRGGAAFCDFRLRGVEIDVEREAYGVALFRILTEY